MPTLFRSAALCIGLTLLLSTARPGGASPSPDMLLGFSGGANAHPHNLSSLNTNVGGVHAPAGGEDQICIFCHTPHGASPSASPLWNRQAPGGPFVLYAGVLEIKSITEADYKTDAALGYPNGSSRMCMSCHDGVTAVGTVLNGDSGGVEIAPGLTMTAAGTVDLATSHPVSFIYDANVVGILKTRAGHADFLSPPAGWLDSGERMQCTTCHDPHVDTNNGTTYRLPLWAHYSGDEDADYSSTCNTCHNAGAGAYPLPDPFNPGDGHQGGF